MCVCVCICIYVYVCMRIYITTAMVALGRAANKGGFRSVVNCVCVPSTGIPGGIHQNSQWRRIFLRRRTAAPVGGHKGRCLQLHTHTQQVS